ncbi:MAG: hypothetical protein F4X55_02910 [Candidatus Dadabacteria bacterium]|nr:hypothetical protein [Candidatus Dadabacteria bacterium]
MEFLTVLKEAMDAIKKRVGKNNVELIYLVLGAYVVLWVIKHLITDMIFPVINFLDGKGFSPDNVSVVAIIVCFFFLLITSFGLLRIKWLDWRLKQVLKRSREKEKMLVTGLEELEELTERAEKIAEKVKNEKNTDS